MKTKILGGIFTLAVMVVLGYGVNKSVQNNADLSDMALSNVEALASGELADCEYGCFANGDGCWCYDWYPCYREAK